MTEPVPAFHQTPHSSSVGLLLAATLCVAVSGCGNGLAGVTGMVTVDGQPLRGGNDIRATVCFQPASGNGAMAIGIVDENGNYKLSTASQEGVAIGDYAVTCSAAQLIRSGSGAASGARRITDAKYASARTSGLKCTVVAGSNEFNIALDAGPNMASQGRGR